eukprot:scaffold407426_cov19-Prasinocladus_malaysianus.AAC.1
MPGGVRPPTLKGQTSVGACPYLRASLPLFKWPHRNLSRPVARWACPEWAWARTAPPACLSRAPSAFAWRMHCLYMEVLFLVEVTSGMPCML